MYPNQIYPILKRHFENDKLRLKSIFVEGASGIGKSQMIGQLVADLGIELRDKRLSQMDAVDLIGTPGRTADGKFTNWAPPDWLDFPAGWRGVLLLDEITSASREVFAASYQLFLDREINGAKLPPGCMVIALGNRLSDRGVINQMPSPLLNRFIKIEAEPHLDSWRDKMGEWGIDPRVIAWISHQPQYLHNFDADHAIKSEPFCSPRSIVSAVDYLDWPDEIRVEMLRGCVGREGASSLESFLRLYTRLPSFDEVMADPQACRIPSESELGERYAMAMMVSSKMDRSTFHKLWVYADRLGSQFVVLATRLAAARDNGIFTARGYRDFTAKHQAVFERA